MDASRTPPPAPPPAAPLPPPRPAVPAAAAPWPAEPATAAPWPAVPAPAAPRPASRARRLAVPLGVLAGAVAAFSYVGAVDPNQPGHYPVCPLLRLTGVLCPGCGGLRSAHAFAHGDLVTAMGANAVAVIGYFAFAAFMTVWLVRVVQGRPAPGPALKPGHWWAIGALVLVFSVVRNLPFGSALAP